MINDLDYKDIKFPVSGEDFDKIKKKNSICINAFCYENNLVYPVYVSIQTFEDCIDLLTITEEGRSHYVYIKDFNRFMCNKTKCKSKKHFCKYCLQCFSSERVLEEHGETCLKTNAKPTLKLRSGSVKYKNHFKQLAMPFKIYVNCKYNVKGVRSSDRGDNTSCTEKHQAHIPCSFVFKLVCVDNKFSKSVALYRGKNVVYRFIKAILKEYGYCRGVIKKSISIRI